MKQKTAIIIGAGPAGLTAAYELLTKTDIKPIIIEKSSFIGGISKTVNYKGNRIDIGGHRFFSKSDRVMKWWLRMMPQERSYPFDYAQGERHTNNDKALLTRHRLSRIYFNRTFFDYPISLTPKTILNLGLLKTIRIGFSYIKQILFPIKHEKNLEDFLINRFGNELYLTFFKSYTEKVWGMPCDVISAEWGAQRIKGISISKAIIHFLKTIFATKKDIAQKETETSLISQFLYPKHGPGQMWETVAEKVKELGGTILMQTNVEKVMVTGDQISEIQIYSNQTNYTEILQASHLFSSMPIKELVNSLETNIPSKIKTISDGLIYRDFITVGLLLRKLKATGLEKDNWIYIQEPDVLVGRLQIFNNWSPYMVADPNTVWIGLEYFCTEGDELWNKSHDELIALAKKELSHIDIINKEDILDATVIKQEKAYPAYFGTYNQFDTLKGFLDCYENLYLIGRNGMHRYNNQDHSMLSAMTAVDNIIKNITTKENIWNVNTEKEYHETK